MKVKILAYMAFHLMVQLSGILNLYTLFKIFKCNDTTFLTFAERALNKS